MKTDNFRDFLIQNGKTIYCGKNETLVSKGDIESGYLYYVNSGLLKSIYTAQDGRQFIKTFVTSNDVIGSLSSRNIDTPNTFTLKALEDSILTRVKYSTLVEASHGDLKLANTIIYVLLDLIIKKEQRAHNFLCLSAEERYIKMIEETPELMKRIKQLDIASYLGITPVALSRIKVRVNKKLKLQC